MPRADDDQEPVWRGWTPILPGSQEDGLPSGGEALRVTLSRAWGSDLSGRGCLGGPFFYLREAAAGPLRRGLSEGAQKGASRGPKKGAQTQCKKA